MPSPFPGMNPYLEQEEVWQDFHNRMIPAISDALVPQVSPHFTVRIQEEFYFHPAEDVWEVKPDVVLRELARPTEGIESVWLPTGGRCDKQNHLEIRDPNNQNLIARIELLTPGNKERSATRTQYVSNRVKALRSGVHFIEIDLLRGWERMLFGSDLPACDYYVMVSPAEERPTAGIWPLGLRHRLPSIPIPLRPPVPKVRLDLQEVLHGVYDRAYYKDYIYQSPPTPPLSPEDTAWAAAILGN